MFFTIDNILSDADVARALQLLKQSRFVDGAISASGYAKSGIKNNQEMEASDSYLSLVAMLDAAIEASPKVNIRLQPRFRTYPIFNRYDVGMFYGEHIDFPIMGGVTQFGRSPGRFGQNFMRTDYSMTLFLTPPGEYEGGELELKVLGESRLIKMQAGSAVCYSTGIPHSVRPVTQGFRIAAIYWFQSLIRNVQIRSELWEQYRLEQELEKSGSRALAERAASIRHNLVRYLAEL